MFNLFPCLRKFVPRATGHKPISWHFSHCGALWVILKRLTFLSCYFRNPSQCWICSPGYGSVWGQRRTCDFFSPRKPDVSPSSPQRLRFKPAPDERARLSSWLSYYRIMWKSERTWCNVSREKRLIDMPSVHYFVRANANWISLFHRWPYGNKHTTAGSLLVVYENLLVIFVIQSCDLHTAQWCAIKCLLVYL